MFFSITARRYINNREAVIKDNWIKSFNKSLCLYFTCYIRPYQSPNSAMWKLAMLFKGYKQRKYCYPKSSAIFDKFRNYIMVSAVMN